MQMAANRREGGCRKSLFSGRLFGKWCIVGRIAFWFRFEMSNGNRKTFLHMARMTKVIDFNLLELRFTFRINWTLSLSVSAHPILWESKRMITNDSCVTTSKDKLLLGCCTTRGWMQWVCANWKEKIDNCKVECLLRLSQPTAGESVPAPSLRISTNNRPNGFWTRYWAS